jgi:hypothetical protein
MKEQGASMLLSKGYVCSSSLAKDAFKSSSVHCFFKVSLETETPFLFFDHQLMGQGVRIF